MANDTELGRKVTLKFLKRQLGGDVLGQRFRHERRVLAGMTHPNIARLYGSGLTLRGQAYLVMEYLEGERLDHYCDQRSLNLPASLALFRRVCGAMDYAQQNLVVHRDQVELRQGGAIAGAAGCPKESRITWAEKSSSPFP